MKNLFFTLTLLGLSIQLTAQTLTWDGEAGTTDWNTAANWNPDMIPSAGDDLFINSSNSIVDLTGSGTAASIEVKGGAVLTIGSAAVLTIDGATADDALETSPSGTIVNDGSIIITNAGSKDGIFSKGMFTNNGSISVNGGEHGVSLSEGNFINSAGATITVTNVNGDHINVDDSGGNPATLTNNGTITVTMISGDDGIYVRDGSTFDNASIINLSATGGDDVIFSEKNGIFNNNSGGVITISSSTDMGMQTRDNGVINNNFGGTINIDAVNNDQIWLDATTSFTNGGILNLTNSGDVGVYVTDASTFTNTVTGQINITDATDHGIYVQGNSSGTATFDNSGTITINGGASSSDGIRLNTGGSFTNNAGATFSYTSSTGSDGIELDALTTLNNSGTIDITSSNNHGVTNEATFNNLAGGMINIDAVDNDQIFLDVTSSFTNDGTLNLTNSGDVGLYVTDGSTFTNSATGAINVTDATDHGIYVQGNSTGTAAFDNSGAITISGGGSSSDGLRLNTGGSFTNNAGATFSYSSSTGGDGIEMDALTTLNNSGTIDITSSDNHGVNNEATFNNLAGGTINIDAVDNDQIFLDATSSFTNDGTLNLTNSGDVGLYVTDASTFTNSATGVANITNATDHGIYIQGNSSGTATIDNSGTFTVTGGGASSDGLRLNSGGSLTNNASAFLNFINTGEDGIQLDANTVVNNSGTISIDGTGPGDEALELDGAGATFNNLTGSLYMVDNCSDDGIEVNNGTIINNDGAIRIDNSAGEDIETFAGFTFNNTSNATFAPGSSPGDLTVKGDLDLGTSCTTFEIDGLTPTTDYDQILNSTSSNTLTISSACAHLDWGTYVPNPNDCFKIVDGSGMVAGNFATITSSNAAINYTIDYPGSEVIICVFASTALPVELVGFSGKTTDRGSELSWETASETDNEGFEIQRSNNGLDWTKIGYVDGNGNSFESIRYSYLDERPFDGDNFYRLKQNDFDGNFEYSNVVSLNFKNRRNKFTFYPNPVDDVLYNDINQNTENLEIHLYDSFGRLLFTQKGVVQEISFGDYEPGVYFLHVVSPTNRTINKIINK